MSALAETAARARRRGIDAAPVARQAEAPDGSFLSVEEISVAYGSVGVLENLSLAVARGEFVALLGSSGCGKTTLLRTIAGFIAPRSGAIRVGGRDVTRQPPDKRGMALVFQSYALWPHMSVAQNIGYGLKLRGMPRPEIARRVGEIQELLGLAGLGERKPANLSGGQRQRVALGRALAIEPDILLLDEPLSNLDARIRMSVRHEISALQRRLGITAIHVTHDREEAMVMADRIVILDAGRIAQVGTPEEVFNRPNSAFVAAFMGADNVVALTAERQGDTVAIAPGPVNRAAEIAAADRPPVSGALEGRFRADSAELTAAEAVADERVSRDCLLLDGTITQVSYPGGLWRHLVDIGGDQIVVDADRPFAPQSKVAVRIPGAGLFLFPAAAQGPDANPGHAGHPKGVSRR